MKHTALALLLGLALLAPPSLAQYDDGTALRRGTAVEPYLRVDAARLDAHLRFLASDALGGRDTATIHGAITAEYVASIFRAAGLEPAGGEGSFLQPYPLVASQLDLEALALEVRDGEGRVLASFAPLDEFALGGFGGDDLAVEAPVVFVGHGLVDEEQGVDDYAGLDVEGKWVLVLAGQPDDQPGLRRASGFRGKREAARARGALGLITATPPGDTGAERWFAYARRSMTSRSLSLPGGEHDGGFLRLYASTTMTRRLLESAGLDLEAELAAREKAAGVGGKELPGVALALSLAVVSEDLQASNVVGLLPGSHPVLGREVVVVSAHMDHVGTDDAGDVFNGADDNASGTTALMMLAEGLAARPRLPRTVLFLAVSGEEKGLLGSEWWVHHPTLDIERVVANVNIDMVGRNDPASIGVTPSDEHEAYNSMVPLARQLGPLAGLEVGFSAGEGRLRRRVDEYFSRSDHENFYALGIPVIFFFAGEHEDYHRVTDTVDKIDQGKVARVVDLVGRLVREVASSPERPRELGEG